MCPLSSNCKRAFNIVVLGFQFSCTVLAKCLVAAIRETTKDALPQAVPETAGFEREREKERTTVIHPTGRLQSRAHLA